MNRNGWTLACFELPKIGDVVRIRCSDRLGVYDVPGKHFLHDDGSWYVIDPPGIVNARVHSWRPFTDD